MEVNIAEKIKELEEMREYEDCKCGSKETYISFSGDVCCYPCFKSLTKKVVVVENNTAKVVADDGGWAVKVRGLTKKYFSKYEDYGYTCAVAFARKIQDPEIKQLAGEGV